MPVIYEKEQLIYLLIKDEWAINGLQPILSILTFYKAPTTVESKQEKIWSIDIHSCIIEKLNRSQNRCSARQRQIFCLKAAMSFLLFTKYLYWIFSIQRDHKQEIQAQNKQESESIQEKAKRIITLQDFPKHKWFSCKKQVLCCMR